ncbi:S9 family peptidase [Seonamhaeicola sediminis]|uniref:S9 family peptidase n=1 Tax=Seonamhaeicola sediminis TaxID=2528206 RepID=A0A562YF13_9FLAO|nr:S9 family peptidase [Seonamhaeicola sediminis]TWO33310.1 S9 family peptidase [Seonamhaeicola sediminis]
MRYLKFSIGVYFILTFFLNAQNQLITLEEIWSGAFRTESMDVLHSMANGKQYSVLNFDRNTGSTAIDIYDYQTLERVESLVSSANISELKYFIDYTFSKDEQKVLLATEVEQLYRHSTKGVYFVYDVQTKEVVKLYDEKVQEPTFSPDGSKVAFAFKNNLYIKDLLSGDTLQITSDGKKNSIINGITDWVYEEEFAFVKAFDWNANSNKIAFIRFDETNVPEFSMDIYGTELYPKQHVLKYPKAGEKNSEVSLHIYDLNSKKTGTVKVDKDYSDFYIPRIKWTNESNVLSAHILNRHQNELDLWFINTQDNTTNLVLEERDKAYIEVTDNLTFLKNNSFIWTSEKDGFNHIYHYSETGKLINQVTMGNWEVTEYYGYDENTKQIFYQSVENGSINRDVYSIKLNGRNKKRLTKKEGTNSASFSADFSYFINSFSSATTPPEYTLNSADSGNLIKSIKDNDRLSQQLSNYKISEKEFSTIHINGNDLNMWMIKPVNFNESKQYPLLMYQYSGPGSQSVANSWHSYNDYWYQHLAQQGYIVACVDGRGTGYKGADFKKVTYLNLVKYETEDQIEAAKILGELPYIDADRIGIWGWSYGGHMSTNCLLKGNDVFKMAIAVAPVTSWRFYDTIYTERFMRTPQENPNGYDDNSPFNYPEMLKGDYLLVHGSGDDNVHVQHTMRMVEALIQANKDFDWAIYPDKNHGIYGGNTRLHLFRKMTNFIHENLGDKRVVKKTKLEETQIKG